MFVETLATFVRHPSQHRIHFVTNETSVYAFTCWSWIASRFYDRSVHIYPLTSAAGTSGRADSLSYPIILSFRSTTQSRRLIAGRAGTGPGARNLVYFPVTLCPERGSLSVAPRPPSSPRGPSGVNINIIITIMMIIIIVMIMIMIMSVIMIMITNSNSNSNNNNSNSIIQIPKGQEGVGPPRAARPPKAARGRGAARPAASSPPRSGLYHIISYHII